jgi:hypothetical protein
MIANGQLVVDGGWFKDFHITLLNPVFCQIGNKIQHILLPL